MMDPDDFDLDYYQREADRAERALGLVGLLWMFMSGAVAGWISRGIWG